MRVFALAALLFTASPAAATTGLLPKWDAPARYQLNARIMLAEQLVLLAEQNYSAGITEIWMDVVTTCTPESVGKVWELVCTLDDVQLHAAPTKADAKNLPAILGEWDERLSSSTVELVVSSDGRIRSIDLEGISKDNLRLKEIQENARLLMARLFAPLDFQLPKKGDDKGKGSWKQNEVLAMKLPSREGSVGNVNVSHTLGDVQGQAYAVTTSGRGVMSAGEMIAVGDQLRPKNMFDLTIDGTATFDAESGRLIAREYTVQGTPTPSSALAETGGIQYIQSVSAVLLGDDDKPDPLGPSKALPVGGSLELEARKAAEQAP